MVSVKEFQNHLLKWASNVHRPMPWRDEKDPYLIWLSEIILQQTRVQQGLNYYLRFKEKYPTVLELANAQEDEVLKLWEGLGYYSRARNMHATAKIIKDRFHGQFPSTYQEILQLKGIGPYTAAAISSFAYNLPHAVVDGNVFRVISRIFGIETPIDSTEGKKTFTQKAYDLLDNRFPGVYNQAIMDFGAIHCTPKKPLCTSCPFKDECFAFQQNKVELLPIKSKKLIKKNRYFNFLVINADSYTIIEKRRAKDIWRNLYQFPLIETVQPQTAKSFILNHAYFKNLSLGKAQEVIPSSTFTQNLTHQKIYAIFWEITIKKIEIKPNNQYFILEKRKLSNYAFPKIIDCYLKDNSLTLKLF